MTKQNIENLEFAAKRVRENPIKAVGEMRSDEGGRCCLAVMSDAAKEKGFLIPQDSKFPSVEGFFSFFGFYFDDFGFEINGEENLLANHNDGFEDVRPKSHLEIGDALLEFVEKQKKKI